MSFDLESAFAVRERTDGLLEKDTFDLSSAVPVPDNVKPDIVQTVFSDPMVSKMIDTVSGGITPEQGNQFMQDIISPLSKIGGIIKDQGKTMSIPEAGNKLIMETGKFVLSAIGGPVSAVQSGLSAAIDNKPAGEILQSMFKGYLQPGEVKSLTSHVPFQAWEQGGWEKLIPRATAEAIESYAISSLVYGNVAGRIVKAYESGKSQAALQELDNITTKISKGIMKEPEKFKVPKDWGEPEVKAYLQNRLGTVPNVGDVLVKRQSILSKLKEKLISESGQINLPKVGDSIDWKGEIGKITKIDGEQVIISLGKSEVVATLSQLSLPKVEEVKQLTEGKVGIPKELEPLAQEARKYKSADEFALSFLKPGDPTFKMTPEGMLSDINNTAKKQANEKYPEERIKRESINTYFNMAVQGRTGGAFAEQVNNTFKPLEILESDDIRRATGKDELPKTGKIKVYRGFSGQGSDELRIGDFVTNLKSEARKYTRGTGEVKEYIVDVKDLSADNTGRNPREMAYTPNGELPKISKSKLDYINFYNQATGKLSPTGEGQKPPIEPPKTAVTKETSLPVLETKLPTTPIENKIQTPTPPETPIPPSELPPEGSMPPENDPVKQVIQALKEAQPIRAEQEALMKAERGRRITKAKTLGEKIGGEAGFHAQLGSLKGEMPKAQFETLRGKINQQSIDELFNRIRKSDLGEWDKLGAQTGLGKLFGEFGGSVPTEGELKVLHQVFGKDFTDALLDNRTLMQKFIYASGELLNIPRSVMASFDLSAPLRQGAFMIGRPKQFIPAFGEMFKYFGSEKVFNALMKEISTRPTYELMVEHGLALTDVGTGLNNREEKFMSSWAEQIPLAGTVIKSSGRAYTGFLNKLRADVFDDLYNKSQSLGVKPTDKFMKDLTTFINAATGRGTFLGKIDKAAVALNSVFFSPRLMASRLNLLNPVFYINKEPFVRKEMLKSLVIFTGLALIIFGLSKLGGAEVGADWRSADFGKIKTGNTRIDILAGFQQYIRMMGQVFTGEYISSHTGKVMTLGEGYRALNRWDILIRQLESKESPVASFIAGWLKGKSYTGEDFNVPQEVATRLIPMVMGDFVDLAKENPMLLPLGIAGLFGVGLQTYDTSSKRSSSTRSSSVKKSRSSSTN